MEALKVVLNPLNVVWNQVLKDFDKAPGWIPLLVAVLLWLQLSGLPEKIEIGERTVQLSAEIIASVITFILYQLGDAIDERMFKVREDGERRTRSLYKEAYKSESSKAKRALRVESGLYGLASKLTEAAEKEREATFVYLFNEAAKFLRSLVVPFFLLGICSIFRHNFVVGVSLLVLSVMVLFLYPWLKVIHIRRLYKLVVVVTNNKRLYTYKDTNGVRLHFWDSKYIDASLVSSSSGTPEIGS
jgi:hypothetical protein